MELRNLIFDIIELSNCYSEEVYSKLESLLQESSHSFGIKFFAELSAFIIDELDSIHETSEFSYRYYEQFLQKKKDFEDIDFEEDEFAYLGLIFKIVEKLYKEDLIFGKFFSLFLTDEQDNPGKHSFIYTDKLIKFIEEKLDLEIYKTTTKGYEEAGLFYYYFFNGKFDKIEEIFKELKCEKEL